MANNNLPHSSSRRRFLQTGVATAASLAVLSTSSETANASTAKAAPGPAVGKPNILLMTVDEQRYPTVYESDELTAFRKDYLTTQETLRQQGLSFQRHYAASVACAPSRASLYTGHYPSLHGVTNTDGAAKASNDPTMWWLEANTVPTLGNYFKTAGYRTFWKGKWHLSHADLLVPGTNSSLASYTSTGEPDEVNEDLYLEASRLADYGFTGWIGPEPHGSNPLNSASSAGAGMRSRDQGFADQLVALIQQLDTEQDPNPWLIVASFLNPHDIALWGFFSNLMASAQQTYDFSVGDEVPFKLFIKTLFNQTHKEDLSTKPSCQLSYRNSYRKFFQPIFAGLPYYRFYYQAHLNVDRQLARVYQALMESSFFDNTIVVFTSDHGDLLDTHGGLHQKWYGAYEEAIHVPLIVSSPLFSENNGKTADMLTSHVDLLPTLLGLAGVDAEAIRTQLTATHTEAQPLVGKDLSALIRGEATTSTLETPIFFMSDDDPSRGQNQNNFIGLAYNSVIQPNHIETVVARIKGKVWKYSRYFDNPQFWSSPGTPGDSGVQDEIIKELGTGQDNEGTTTVRCQKTVKLTPAADEYEMYNLSDDPMELSNLAGVEAYAAQQKKLASLLQQQLQQKRLTPNSGTVPGQ